MKRLLRSLAMTYFLFFAFLTPTWAQTPEAAFYDANRLYSEGKYEEAAQKYLAILQSGVESAQIYFNTGNSYFKLKQKGKARLYYEKALRLDPRDAELLYNLRLLQSQLEDRVAPQPRNIIDEKITRLIDRFNEREWLSLFTAGYLLVFVSSVLWLFLLRRRKRLAALTLSLALFWLAATFGLVMKEVRINQSRGIILSAKVKARYGPTPQDVVAFTLHEGTYCEILGSTSGWLQIRLLDGKIAWIPEPALEQI